MSQARDNGHSVSARKVRARPADRTWSDVIQDEPIACLAAAAAAGFVLGGGARQAGGMTILTILGQIIVRETLGESALGDLFSDA
jgi:hypothetical protein